MARLIDANFVVYSAESEFSEEDAAKVRWLISHIPTIDAEPVRHGRWKYFHKQNRAVCLVCSFERDLDADFGKAVSCPNCGAKMDLEE